MPDRIYEGFQSAYCPEHDTKRTIHAKILAHPTLGDVFFDVLQFDCNDVPNCPFAQKVAFCPFLVDVLRSIKQRY